MAKPAQLLKNAQAYKAEKAEAWARKGVKVGPTYAAAVKAASPKPTKARKSAPRKSTASKSKGGN